VYVFTTMIDPSHNRRHHVCTFQFILTVLYNEQPVQQFTLEAPPTIQWRDVNADGIDDLMISIKEGTKPVIVAAFCGADATRLV
jgi:hypothetical protein